MQAIGIICEYNPFHNGHLYHIKSIKKLYPDSIIILVMSGNFLQRGDVSVINKWDKAKIALTYGVDIVVELPFHFATQSSDIFAHGAVSILNSLGVNKIVFGSESNNIKLLSELADIQINNSLYDKKVKEYMDSGCNYPSAMSKALKDINGKTINKPNDLLGLSYIKEMVPNVTTEIVNQLKNLKPGNCIAFGSAFKVPIPMYVDLPNPRPLSNNVDLANVWYNVIPEDKGNVAEMNISPTQGMVGNGPMQGAMPMNMNGPSPGGTFLPGFNAVGQGGAPSGPTPNSNGPMHGAPVQQPTG